jgi:hypothetical protein
MRERPSCVGAQAVDARQGDHPLSGALCLAWAELASLLITLRQPDPVIDKWLIMAERRCCSVFSVNGVYAIWPRPT